MKIDSVSIYKIIIGTITVLLLTAFGTSCSKDIPEQFADEFMSTKYPSYKISGKTFNEVSQMGILSDYTPDDNDSIFSYTFKKPFIENVTLERAHFYVDGSISAELNTPAENTYRDRMVEEAVWIFSTKENATTMMNDIFHILTKRIEEGCYIKMDRQKVGNKFLAYGNNKSIQVITFISNAEIIVLLFYKYDIYNPLKNLLISNFSDYAAPDRLKPNGNKKDDSTGNIIETALSFEKGLRDGNDIRVEDLEFAGTRRINNHLWKDINY